MRWSIGFGLAACGTLAACAGLQFSNAVTSDSMPFYVAVPALQITQTADCGVSAQVISIPGEQRSIRFRQGVGTAKLSFKLTNGMLTEVNSETSGAATDAIALARQVATMVPWTTKTVTSGCDPSVELRSISYASGAPVIGRTPIYRSSKPERVSVAPVAAANESVVIDLGNAM